MSAHCGGVNTPTRTAEGIDIVASGFSDDSVRFAESNGIDMYSLEDVAHQTSCARPHSLNKG